MDIAAIFGQMFQHLPDSTKWMAAAALFLWMMASTLFLIARVCTDERVQQFVLMIVKGLRILLDEIRRLDVSRYPPGPPNRFQRAMSLVWSACIFMTLLTLSLFSGVFGLWLLLLVATKDHLLQSLRLEGIAMGFFMCCYTWWVSIFLLDEFKGWLSKR
ncbi:hypothetical protein [Mesorhizobium sp. J8]|uniref:hypothetical protein n=1 Tax=Mesorhizobium sp. J8 TaxID=2777475 RepID=UPI001915D9B5|nr:hypothetical protein [Mesorhizobium sp. J8]BCM17795.1 hypothetical protein MJ8_15610 [Mesorhizobium sp. J8]